MTLDRPLRVGSRGSPLALIQDDEAISQLKARHPGLEFEVVIVRTSGDANQTAPLAGMGLGVFVSEIEERLLSGDLDMAVHSLKDLPTKLPDGLVLGAIMERRDPRDVLVNRWNCPLLELPSGARIGTSSPRRAAQLRRFAPGVEIVPIRGNVETRLRKAAGDEADGAVLAAAGLVRLGMEDRVSDYLSPQRFVPPPGQGALAVEVRADDRRMPDILKSIEHPATRFEVTAERAFLETLGGGCSLPVGAYARTTGPRAVDDRLPEQHGRHPLLHRKGRRPEARPEAAGRRRLPRRGRARRRRPPRGRPPAAGAAGHRESVMNRNLE